MSEDTAASETGWAIPVPTPLPSVPVKAESVEETIIRVYKERLLSMIEHVEHAQDTWFGCLELSCWSVPEGSTAAGFSKGSGWQYDLRAYDGTRPKAYRIPFLLHPEFKNPDYTVSHLCHNNWCMKPSHHVLESLAMNKARNGCPGGTHCHHEVRCIMPGPYSSGK